jgi:CDP-diacylglycerol--glycerol-3-phosphate 3-phosphatidyltransferase
VVRVLLVPFLVVLILARERSASYVAALVFAVGAATDGLDGYLARRHASTTRTGQWLDPLADKVLVAAPVITLAAMGEFPVWAAVVIVAREIAVSLLRVALGLRGRAMPATPSAKVKTFVQLTAIALYILPLGVSWHGLKLGLLIAAVVLTVWTGLQYVVRAAPQVRRTRAVPPIGSTPPA